MVLGGGDLGQSLHEWHYCLIKETPESSLIPSATWHHVKCWVGWIRSWNQDSKEKYQQPQMCRCYHTNGRKWRRTEELLDESERGEWKSWLKTQHSENFWSHHFMANRERESGNSVRFYIFGLQNHCRWWLQPWNEKMLAPWKKSCDQPRQHIKRQKHYFTNKSPSSQSHGFSNGHVWMWDLDYKESWAPKNWCFWTLALEKMLESPLGCKEIQPVHPKGVFIGKNSPGCSLERLILKLKLHYFGHFMQRTDSFEKTLMLGKTEGGRRRGRQGMRWLDGLSKLQELVMDREALRAAVNGVTKSRTWLSDWTELNWAQDWGT